MTIRIQENFRVRKNFGKLRQILDVPYLIEIQKKSYEKFLQTGKLTEEREDIGLQGVFKKYFPIKDYNETCELEFIEYRLEPPKYDVEECRQREATYGATLRVSIRLITWERDEETGERRVKDVRNQEVYFGEIPLMTEHGTFVINGTERVIVSQLHRSPGVFFEQDKNKSQQTRKKI